MIGVVACLALVFAGVGAFGGERRVAKVEKPVRLPVWPVLNGLGCIALDLVGLGDAAAALEDKFGGRVAPMSLGPEANPFVLLVHHRHGFDAWDPVRPLFERLIGLPEGFPAHPHRGFETVTMTLRGGLAHRDSAGVKETYGDGDVQWLTAGSGILHEEMWHWGDAEKKEPRGGAAPARGERPRGNRPNFQDSRTSVNARSFRLIVSTSVLLWSRSRSPDEFRLPVSSFLAMLNASWIF